jgi:hypothetical protein
MLLIVQIHAMLIKREVKFFFPLWLFVDHARAQVFTPAGELGTGTVAVGVCADPDRAGRGGSRGAGMVGCGGVRAWPPWPLHFF